MTTGLAWTALALGVLALGYFAVCDVRLVRRVNRTEKLAQGLRGDVLELIRDQRNDRLQIHARIDSLGVVGPNGAVNRPERPQDGLNDADGLRVPETVTESAQDDTGRTDTAPATVAIDRSWQELAASYGRHHAKEAP